MASENQINKRDNRRWLGEFINLYQSAECLWDPKHPNYGKNNMRNEAYDKLVEKLKEVQPNADREKVIRKINTLRTAFRREYRKTISKENYKSRLWYYKRLLFIHNISREPRLPQPKSPGERSPEQFAIEPEITYSELDDLEVTLLDSDSQNDLQLTVKAEEQHIQLQEQGKENNQLITGQLIQLSPTFSSAHKHDDEYDAMGIYFASKLRRINTTQRIIAEKLINDVLFNAQLDNLTEDSTLTIRRKAFKCFEREEMGK